MGRICYNYNIKEYKVLREGQHPKKEEDVVEVQVGEWDDYYVHGITTEFMWKRVYENIIKGIYKVVNTPYDEVSICVFDEENNLIELITR